MGLRLIPRFKYRTSESDALAVGHENLYFKNTPRMTLISHLCATERELDGAVTPTVVTGFQTVDNATGSKVPFIPVLSRPM